MAAKTSSESVISAAPKAVSSCAIVVAPKIDEFNTDNLLPSTGFGLRFMASEDHRVNIGIDYAFGRESQALYFRIGEAF